MTLALDWYWPGLVVVVLVAFLLPLVLLRGRRLAYATVVSAVLVVVVGGLWLGDWQYSSSARMVFGKRFTPTENAWKWVWLVSGNGGLEFVFTSTIVNDPHMLEKGTPESRAEFVWSRVWQADPEYPHSTFSHATHVWSWQQGGFVVEMGGESVRPKSHTYLHTAVIIVPNQFAMLLFSILPAYWAYQQRWGIVKIRRRQNLCEKCGYALHGLPKVERVGGVCCPECGTIAVQQGAKPAEIKPG